MPEKKKAATAAITGSAGGVSLVALANSLTEPYKSIATYLAPACSAFVAVIWPRIQEVASSHINRVMLRWDLNVAVTDLKKFIVEQQKIVDDTATPDDLKGQAKKNIRDAQEAIMRKNRLLVADHLKKEGSS